MIRRLLIDTISLSRLLPSSFELRPCTSVSNVAHLVLRTITLSLRPLSAEFRIRSAPPWSTGSTSCVTSAPCPTQDPGVLNFDSATAGSPIEHQATAPSSTWSTSFVWGSTVSGTQVRVLLTSFGAYITRIFPHSVSVLPGLRACAVRASISASTMKTHSSCAVAASSYYQG